VRILGIDPSLLVCGYAVLDFTDGDESLLEAGVIRTKAKDAMEFRLNCIAKDLDSILKKYKPDVVAVEDLYSHYAHPKTAILMGHARGVILQRATAKSVEVKSFGATQIKKSITGNGHASKAQMQKTVQAILGLKELPEPHDVADAIAAALCCAGHIRAEEKLGATS